MTAARQSQGLATPPTGAPVFPPVPEHPLQFASAQRVGPLHRRFHNSWGPLSWIADGASLTACWPQTGGFLRLLTASAGEITAEWLLVDPSGDAAPRHGHGTLELASSSLLQFAGSASASTGPCPEARFWELVTETDLRLELLGGRLYAMAGASLTHEAVVMSIGAALKSALRGSGCIVAGSNVYTQSSKSDRHLPDLVVICGRPRYASATGQPDQLVNPTILVEVESPTSRHRDRVVKPAAYAQVESLESYLVVDLEARSVTVWSSREDRWSQETHSSGPLELHGVQVDIGDFFDQLALLGG